jgi:hypothetical protein
MNSFDTLWSYLQQNLNVGTVIKNWTAFGGYLGDTMTIVGVRDNYIEVDPPKAGTTQSVPKADFEKVWQDWVDYKNQKVKRQELTEYTRFSKYIISILHWYENS